MKRVAMFATLLLTAGAVLALLHGPVGAQETPQQEATTAPADDEPTEDAQADDTPADDAKAEDPKPAESTPAADEGLSADNSLSFPVDI